MTYISKKWLEMPIIETTINTKTKYRIFCNTTCIGVLLLNTHEYARMLKELYTTPYYLRADINVRY